MHFMTVILCHYTNVKKVTILNYLLSFSLYSMESENRLQIFNNSEIPVQISWRIYNESKENKPFGVLIDTLTPDYPDHWSFRITNYDGLENPQYFIVS